MKQTYKHIKRNENYTENGQNIGKNEQKKEKKRNKLKMETFSLKCYRISAIYWHLSNHSNPKF